MFDHQSRQKISNPISYDIDCIRGLACLGVIWGHSIYGFKYPLELNGAFWVWVFFPISGYLVGKGFINKTYKFNAQGVFNFLINRGLRILPLAYIALSLGLLIFIVGDVRLPSAPIKQFFFIAPLNGMTLSGPLWSVAVEVQFYLIAVMFIPLLIGANTNYKLWLTFLLYVASLYLGYISIKLLGDNSAQPRTLICNLSFFIFGFLLADIRPVSIRYSGLVKFIASLALISLAWYLNNYRADYFWAWGILKLPLGGGAAIACCLVAIILLVDEKTVKIKELKFFIPISWCGFYCYGIYVWHSILATLNNQIFKLPPGIELLALLSLSILIAPISYSFIEKPFLKFKRSNHL
jgi:peptidoglycan/LPS O-acetylase OafA/YrhL